MDPVLSGGPRIQKSVFSGTQFHNFGGLMFWGRVNVFLDQNLGMLLKLVTGNGEQETRIWEPVYRENPPKN